MTSGTPRRVDDRTRIARYVAGAVLALAAIYACVASVDWTQFVDSFRTTRPVWVAFALVSIPLSLAILAARWGVLLGVSSPRSWRKLWDSVVVGQAINIVFPFRLGEGARVALTCRELDLPTGRVVVALVLERALDTAMLCAALMLVTGGWVPQIDVADSALLRAAAVLAVVMVVVLIGAIWLLSGTARSRPLFRRKSVVTTWIDAQLTAVREGWTGIRRPRTLAATVTLTVCGTIASISTNLLVFQAFGLHVPWLTAVALLVFLQLGNTIVSVPGNVGVFHYVTVLVLGMMEVPKPTALAVAVVLHAVSLGPKVALGALALVVPFVRQRALGQPEGDMLARPIPRPGAIHE